MAPRLSTRRISKAENMKCPSEKPKGTIGVRHIQALMITGGFFCCYTLRVSLSVAVVAMTSAENASSIPTFDWSDDIQNLLLSSFFWGYVITHIPGGMVAQAWGAQRIFAIAIGLCSIFTLLIPLAANHGGYVVVIVCRVMMGLCQGVVPPVIHTLLAKWVPLEERGRFTSFVYSGGWIGNVIALQSSGLLAASVLGWPSCFYFWGACSLAWAIMWFFLGKESPSEHPAIPNDEKAYIETSLGVIETSEPMSTPWKAILTSGPVWALLIAQCAQSWGFWLLLTKIPAYMSSVLGYDIQNNGLMSSLPYLAAWLCSFPISIGSDTAIRKNLVTTKFSRMACNTFGLLLPAAALIFLGFVSSEQGTLAIIILVIAVSTNVAIYCGHHSNHMDLSPNFSGPLMGFTNGAANICSILAPLMVGVIVKDTTSVAQWRGIFFLTAGIYVFGALAFLLFGSVKVQPWNDSDSTTVKLKPFCFPKVSPIPDSVSVIKEDEKIR